MKFNEQSHSVSAKADPAQRTHILHLRLLDLEAIT